MPKLEPLTKKEWKTFTGKAQWDSMMGLRGPDYLTKAGYKIKFSSASVLRWRMRKIIRVGGLVNEIYDRVIIPSNYQYFKIGSWHGEHYYGHIHDAAGYLSVPIIWVDGEKWHEHIHNPASSVYGLYTWAKENEYDHG